MEENILHLLQECRRKFEGIRKGKGRGREGKGRRGKRRGKRGRKGEEGKGKRAGDEGGWNRDPFRVNLY